MTSTTLPLMTAPRAPRDLGLTVWLFGLSLAAFASLLPLHLLEQSGAVGLHWIHCIVIVALTALTAATALGYRNQTPRRKQEIITARRDTDRSRLISGVAAARQSAIALAHLRIQHQLRDPLHHARMIVRDLEAVGGPPDSLEYVRSLRAHIDEISRTVGGGEMRASFAARFEERPPRSEVLS